MTWHCSSRGISVNYLVSKLGLTFHSTHTGHFGDKSLQAINCTNTNNEAVTI